MRSDRFIGRSLRIALRLVFSLSGPGTYFFEKCYDYMRFSMLEGQDRFTGYRNGLVNLEGDKGNQTPGEDPIDKLPESIDGDDDWDFTSAMDREFAQRVSVKWKLQNLQYECRTIERKLPTDVTEAVELAQELLGSADAPVYSVPLLKVSVSAGRDTTKLAAESDTSKACIVELEWMVTTTVRRHEEFLDKV